MNNAGHTLAGGSGCLVSAFSSEVVVSMLIPLRYRRGCSSMVEDEQRLSIGSLCLKDKSNTNEFKATKTVANNATREEVPGMICHASQQGSNTHLVVMATICILILHP